jgi:hypothetical protein
LWTTFEKIYLFWVADVSENGVLAIAGEPWWVGRPNAFVVRGDQLVTMQVPPECQENRGPLGISSNGLWMAGYCNSFGTNNEIPTLYDTADGADYLLGFPAEAPIERRGWAYAVNDKGTAVGFAFYLPEYTTHGLVWVDNEVHEVPNSIGGSFVGLFDVNNHDIAVGNADDASGGNFLAVSYDIAQGILTVLGCDGARAINERNQVVGSDSFGGVTYATVFEDGGVRYLNEFLPSQWEFIEAEDINNYGWIVGDADDENGDSVYWLLVPIYPKGDYDGDDDVDLHDFGHFQECFAAEPYQGPEGGLHVGCSVFDFDDDIDLDGDDYAAFQAAFTGAITSGW